MVIFALLFNRVMKYKRRAQPVKCVILGKVCEIWSYKTDDNLEENYAKSDPKLLHNPGKKWGKYYYLI